MERRDGDSSPVGYRMASAMALKEALSKAAPKLMEPIMWVEINVPEEFVGDVVGLLGAKGAKIEKHDRSLRNEDCSRIGTACQPVRFFHGPAICHSGPGRIHDEIFLFRCAGVTLDRHSATVIFKLSAEADSQG